MSAPTATATAAEANENGNEERQQTENTLEKSDKEFLLVVVTFLATVAFQAGINPPGGVWQDANNATCAGKSIMATKQPSLFIDYIVSTTVGMVASMLQIMVMIIAYLPNNRQSFSRNFLFVTCSFAIGTMAKAYWSAVRAFTLESMMQKVTTALIGTMVFAAVILPIIVYFDRRGKCPPC